MNRLENRVKHLKNLSTKIKKFSGSGKQYFQLEFSMIFPLYVYQKFKLILLILQHYKFKFNNYEKNTPIMFHIGILRSRFFAEFKADRAESAEISCSKYDFCTL